MHSPTRLPRLRRALGAIALAGLLAGTFLPGVARAADFPAKDSRFHNYAEMVSDIHAVAAAHPNIVQVFSIGKSYEGRDIWAAKISDNVAVDENEPEILFDALHHAREHMTVEQALYLLHLLADNYATDSTVKTLVDGREVFIVFEVNPDGGEFDLTCTTSSHPPYCAWRKTRQPNPGSTYKGTDPNRNYGYHWACCGGSSSSPSALEYHGSAAWSSTEVRVIRDFVNSRVINGRQQIRAHITFHTNGELVLWPYGYTKTDVPYDMTSLDHQAFVALGKGMASRNRYTPEQSSDLYITDGDQIDWLYGIHRIFSFTWELSPTETPTVWGDHYLPDEQIAPVTSRNRSALLYLIDVGSCAYRALGLIRTDCGALFDDIEINRGWKVNPDGTDTATAGVWQRANPGSISANSKATQLGTTPSGSIDFVTQAAVGGTASKSDVDGGVTTVRSAPVTIPATVGPLTFRYYLAHQYGGTAADGFRAYVEDAGGTRTLVFQKAGSAADVAAAWTSASVSMAPWVGKTVRLVFTATDADADNLVEAAFDDVRIERP
ncbi:MAG: M14 family metallopeptidase [Chloroflexota bacterium]